MTAALPQKSDGGKLMNKLKTLSAAVLTGAMVLSMTACDESAPATGNSGGAAPTTTAATTTATTTTFARNDDVVSAVGEITDKVDNADLNVNRRIKWMAWWDMDETTPAAELFKSVYGVPTEGSDPEREGRIFEYTSVAYAERYDKLGAAISADDSPDFFPFEILDFPYGVLMGRYQPVDEIIDLDSAKWAATKDLRKMFELNGRQYCAFYEISLNDMMYYRTSMIDDIGADDPRTLFENGNWTWDTFLEIARSWQESGDDRYVIDGYNPENDFVLSTGTPLVGNVDGKIVNNLYDPAIERVENNMLAVLQKENLRYPRHELNGWSVNPKAWADGQILFYCDGGRWVFEETLTKYAKKNGWAEDEIKFVPFPKDPQADAHYITLKQDAMMWCKGSDYADGVAAWLDCSVTAAQDEKVIETAKLQAIENYGWTRDNIDFYYSLTALDGTSPVTPIVDFKGGLGTVSDGSATENPIQSLTNLVYLTGESYTQLRETHNPAIQAAIDEINASIQGNS